MKGTCSISWIYLLLHFLTLINVHLKWTAHYSKFYKLSLNSKKLGIYIFIFHCCFFPFMNPLTPNFLFKILSFSFSIRKNPKVGWASVFRQVRFSLLFKVILLQRLKTHPDWQGISTVMDVFHSVSTPDKS